METQVHILYLLAQVDINYYGQVEIVTFWYEVTLG
jgi:hypothetical protein